MNESRRTDEFQTELDSINKLGDTCWQFGHASIVDFEPLRAKNGCPIGGTKVRDMDRFILQVDGPTMFDAQLLSDGRLKIIYNGCRQDRCLEDAAFNSKTFDKGKIVTFHQIERQFKVFVRLCNGRLNNASWRGKKITYNPVTHKVRVRAAS